MAMSLGGDPSRDIPGAEINVTPLADVMLVLLIIFIITAQLTSEKVHVKLPLANPETKVEEPPAPPVDVAITMKANEGVGSFDLFVDGQAVSEALFKQKMAVAASQKPQPQINVRADKALDYGVIRKVVDDAKSQGIVHVGFITEGTK